MESLLQIPTIQQLFIISYNINSYYNRLEEVEQLITLNPDILFLSETKISKSNKSKLQQISLNKYTDLKDTHINKYTNIFSNQNGRVGVGIFIRQDIQIQKIKIQTKQIENSLGRFIQLTILFQDKEFVFIFLYTPNSGRQLKTLDLRNKWDQEFLKYCKKIDNLICIIGDLNIIPTQYDIHDFKRNYNKSAGVTQLEIDNYQNLLDQINLFNTIRYLHKTQRIYTYFSYFGQSKQNNKGWTLDQCLLKNTYINNLIDSNVIKMDSNTSDHLPIYVKLKLF